MKYSSIENLIKRILISPFVFGIILVTHLWFVLKMTVRFLRYGGEFATYESEDFATIQMIYKQLKEKP